ncbi:MAG: efflux RND transporter periplasmic adaptor subunit [Moraxellaceae bacterium]|nr:efflux RND transporter periplasmic adaptor subunit [Moraxellaceae bacterium]
MSSSRFPDLEKDNNIDTPLSSANDNNIQSNKSKIAIYSLLAIILLIVGIMIGVFYNQSKAEENTSTENNDNSEQTSLEDKQDEGNPVLTIDVLYPKVGNVPLTITVDGELIAENTASVSSKLSGVTVDEILVKEGDTVQKGQLLAKLDPSQLEQSVIQAQAQIVQANASLNNATSTLERVKPLLAINAVSKQEVDNYATQAKQAQASLMLAQAQYNNQMLRLKDSQVLAPVSGVISKKTANVGSLAQGSLFTIIENGILEWQAKVSPNYLKELKIGMPVKLTTPTQEEIYGEISRIEPTMGQDRQVNVRVKLQADKNATIQTGMLLTGEILLGEQQQMIVPISSIVGEDGYNYLVTVTNIEKDANNQVTGEIKRIKVQLGKQVGKSVAIKTNIPKDMVIAFQGGSFVNNGDKVRINTSNKTTNNTQQSTASAPPSTLQKPATNQ